MPGQRCWLVIASNPPIGGEGAWLITWFQPWLDPAFPDQAAPGELRWCVTAPDGAVRWVDGPGRHRIDGRWLTAFSRSFIPSRLADNRFLRDTGYRAGLEGRSPCAPSSSPAIS